MVRKGDGEPYLDGMIGATGLGIERIFFLLNTEMLCAVRDAACP